MIGVRQQYPGVLWYGLVVRMCGSVGDGTDNLGGYRNKILGSIYLWPTCDHCGNEM